MTQAADSASSTDPVCGMQIDPATAKHRVPYENAEYCFCSAACAVGAIATSMVFPPSREEAAEPFTLERFVHNAHLTDHA